MANIYQTRYFLKVGFITLTLLLVSSFLYVSNNLMDALEQEERSRMEIWAEATRQLAGQDNNMDMGLVLKVIQSNTTIPVVILDDQDQILWHLNYDIPASDSTQYMQDVVADLKTMREPIEVVISRKVKQYLYYDDSVLLKQLQYFPYIQLGILCLFVLLSFWAFSSTQRAEQNQIWVGLSKETAHQLGTPISSLMAWVEYLRSMGQDTMVVDEMDKDIHRLNTIADRFSKIGSQPQLSVLNFNNLLDDSLVYMRKRVSSKVQIDFVADQDPIFIRGSQPLLEWVVENVCKNSVDATQGKGNITLHLSAESGQAVLLVMDNGKGILRKHFKTIFNPGFTTKKRGWGLGLTLTKRIIEQYHKGNISVVESIPNERTTIRISIPLEQSASKA